MDGFGSGETGYQRSVRSPPRSLLAALAVTAGLGLGAVACTKTEDEPASPASTASPASSGDRPTDANSVPPGASGEGARGNTGQGQSNP